jgi:hypothetical protein
MVGFVEAIPSPRIIRIYELCLLAIRGALDPFKEGKS